MTKDVRGLFNQLGTLTTPAQEDKVMLLHYAICKVRRIPLVICGRSQRVPTEPERAKPAIRNAYLPSIPLLVLTLAIPFATGVTQVSRSTHQDAATLLDQSSINVDRRALAPTDSGKAQTRASSDAAAVELLRHVVDKYRSLLTYSDRGTSIVHLANIDYTVEFETLFKRPSKLRFTWTVEYSRIPGRKQNGLIWSDGANVWASYSFHGSKLEPKKSVDLAVAGAIGASGSSAHTIVRLLTDEISGVRLDELHGLKIVGNDTLDGLDCVVLVGYQPSGGERKVWIGRNDYLIRRIEDRSKTGTQEEVRMAIVLNEDIPDTRFSERGR